MHSQTDYAGKYPCSIFCLLCLTLMVFVFHFDQTFFLFLYAAARYPFESLGLVPDLNTAAVLGLTVLLAVPLCDWIRSGEFSTFVQTPVRDSMDLAGAMVDDLFDEPQPRGHAQRVLYVPFIAASILIMLAYAVLVGDYVPDTFIEFETVWFTLEGALLFAIKAVQVNPKGRIAPLLIAACTVLLLAWMFGIPFFMPH